MTLIVSADSTHGDRAATRSPPSSLVPSIVSAACGTRCRIALDDFAIITIDPAIEATTGIATAEWRTAGFWNAFVHPDDRAALDDAHRNARVGKDVVARFRLRMDTTYLPMLLYGAPATEETEVAGGRAAFEGFLMVDAAPLLAATRELSRRLDAATEEADELSRAVLASFPGYVAAISTDGVVLAANDAWTMLHSEAGSDSLAASGVGGNYLTALRDAAAGDRPDFVRVYDAVRRVLQDGTERARVEYVCEISQRSFVLLVQRLKSTTGGIIVTHLDVTERAQGARALHQARQELMRAAQLAVAGELVGAITHDIRQPLTALQMDIGVAIHLLRQKTPAVPEALNALEDVLADELRVQESLQVLQDLVARREPRREQIALGGIAIEVARLVGTEAAARQVALDLQLEPTIATFPGDPTLLREAVLSLLLDAVENAEAIDDQLARVTIATHQLDDGHVELSVTHPRWSDAVSNNRWGLSVAKSVAEAHHADVVVDNDPVSGVTVRTIWPTLAEAGNLQV